MEMKRMERLVRKHLSTQSHGGGASFAKEKDAGLCFKIGWNSYVSFWKDYCLALQESERSFENSPFYEYNQTEATLCFYLSFKFVHEVDEIPIEVINSIASIASEVALEKLNLSENDTPLICILQGINRRKVVLGFNLPAIRVDQKFFNTEILPSFCNKLRQNGVLAKLPHETYETWERIVAPMDNFFPVYGSKNLHCETVLEFIGVWVLGSIAGEDITEYFTANSHSSFQSRCGKEISQIDNQDPMFIPIIMSSKFSSEITLPKIEPKETTGSAYMSEISSPLESDMIYHLLPLISKKRLENPMYRWQIGRAVFNIMDKSVEGSTDGLHLFNSYTPFAIEENNLNWEFSREDSGVNDHLTIRTIGYFAKEDNPDGYNEWHNSWMKEAVMQSLDKIELNVAEVMYRLFWLDFITVGRKRWFFFTPGSTALLEMANGAEFTSRFSEIIRFYAKIQKENCDKLISLSGDDDIKKRVTDQGKCISDIVKKLGTITYQRAIESHCFSKFYRRGVEEFFNNNPRLIAWSNVVTEVHGDDIFARPGKMEDFITVNSDIPYRGNDYSWDHPLVEELMYWFKTTFVGEGLVEYFLKICASLLYGRNPEKLFYAFCGPSGDNSKSMIAKLLQKVMPSYVVDFPVNVLTDDRQSGGGPTPALALAKGARAAFIAEPDGNIPFMGSLIKRYSGGDRFFARKCNENGEYIHASFKMILFCNAVPPIEGADEAVMNRLTILPFLSKYTNDCPDNVDDQFKERKFPKDPFFEDKIEAYRRPMAWIMVQYFPIYKKEGLERPKIVEEYTVKYWEENDPYKLFVTENMERVFKDEKLQIVDASQKINITTVYRIFKIWHQSNFNQKRTGVPDIAAMLRHLSAPSHMGPPTNRIWNGWKIRENDDSKNNINTAKKMERRHNLE